MITFIQEHHKNGISRREYHCKDEREASRFAHVFGGSYFKLLEDYYRILI
jgi:hypothetical protein